MTVLTLASRLHHWDHAFPFQAQRHLGRPKFSGPLWRAFLPGISVRLPQPCPLGQVARPEASVSLVYRRLLKGCSAWSPVS